MLGKFRKRPDESFFVNGLLEAAFFVIAEDKTNRGLSNNAQAEKNQDVEGNVVDLFHHRNTG